VSCSPHSLKVSPNTHVNIKQTTHYKRASVLRLRFKIGDSKENKALFFQYISPKTATKLIHFFHS